MLMLLAAATRGPPAAADGSCVHLPFCPMEGIPELWSIPCGAGEGPLPSARHTRPLDLSFEFEALKFLLRM
jgi:hypothetical protein